MRLVDAFVSDVSPVSDRRFQALSALREQLEKISFWRCTTGVSGLYRGINRGIRAAIRWIEVVPFADVFHATYYAIRRRLMAPEILHTYGILVNIY